MQSLSSNQQHLSAGLKISPDSEKLSDLNTDKLAAAIHTDNKFATVADQSYQALDVNKPIEDMIAPAENKGFFEMITAPLLKMVGLGGDAPSERLDQPTLFRNVAHQSDDTLAQLATPAPKDPYSDTYYQHNLLSNSIFGADSGKIVSIAFSAPDAKAFIDMNFLQGLGAIADDANRTVRIPLSDHQPNISITTPNEAIFTLHHNGDFTYNIGHAHTSGVENFQYALQDKLSGNLYHTAFDMHTTVHQDKVVLLSASETDQALNQSHAVQIHSLPEGHLGDQYIIDLNHTKGEKIVIRDLGISKENVLSFIGIKDIQRGRLSDRSSWRSARKLIRCCR